MAMQTYQANYGNAASSLRLNVYTISTSQNNNNSIERADLWMVVNTNQGYWNNYGTPASIGINGNNTNQSVKYDARKPAGSTVLLIGSWDTNVAHDGNGNSNIPISATHQSGTGLGNASLNGSYQCDNIPRYANFTRLDCVGQTVNSIKIAWAADADCDAVDYNINGGSPISGNYPEFTVNSLEYNTSYTIKVNIRRSGSGLWSSKEINVRTLDKNRFEGAVNNLDFGDYYSFNFRQNAGAATFINVFDSNNNKIFSRDTKADGTLNNVIAYTLNFTQEELDKIYKLYKSSNFIPLKLQLETEYYGARYYDEHTKECILTGNAKTIKTKQNNTLKRGKIYIKQNGQLKKAVVWTKQNNVVKRCM